MNNDLQDLYQELILDHGKSPRNFRRLDCPPASTAEGFNPLCGDRIEMFVREDGGSVAEASFEGEACAICTASASMLTDAVKGLTSEEIERLADRFIGMLTDADAADEELDGGLGKLSVLSGVARYPMRVKCATLPWHTLRSALGHGDATVSTE